MSYPCQQPIWIHEGWHCWFGDHCTRCILQQAYTWSWALQQIHKRPHLITVQCIAIQLHTSHHDCWVSLCISLLAEHVCTKWQHLCHPKPIWDNCKQKNQCQCTLQGWVWRLCANTWRTWQQYGNMYRWCHCHKTHWKHSRQLLFYQPWHRAPHYSIGLDASANAWTHVWPSA